MATAAVQAAEVAAVAAASASETAVTAPNVTNTMQSTSALTVAAITIIRAATASAAELGLGGSYVPRASDPVCSLRSSGIMTGVMRDPRSRERRRRHRGYRPLRCDRLSRERGVASRGPEAIRPQWGMPERTGCRGATAPRRRRQGIRRPSGRDGDALKLVEARRSVLMMMPRRPGVGRRVAPLEAPGGSVGTRGRRA